MQNFSEELWMEYLLYYLRLRMMGNYMGNEISFMWNTG